MTLTRKDILNTKGQGISRCELDKRGEMHVSTCSYHTDSSPAKTFLCERKPKAQVS